MERARIIESRLLLAARHDKEYMAKNVSWAALETENFTEKLPSLVSGLLAAANAALPQPNLQAVKSS